MTDTTGEKTGNEAPAKAPTFTWRGRTMMLRIPSATQLMTWNRVAQEFGDIGKTPEDEEIDQDRFKKALRRMGSIVFGMFASDEDKDWLEEQILEGEVEDRDLLEMFVTIGDALEATKDDKGGGKTVKKAARRVRA